MNVSFISFFLNFSFLYFYCFRYSAQHMAGHCSWRWQAGTFASPITGTCTVHGYMQGLFLPSCFSTCIAFFKINRLRKKNYAFVGGCARHMCDTAKLREATMCGMPLDDCDRPTPKSICHFAHTRTQNGEHPGPPTTRGTKRLRETEWIFSTPPSVHCEAQFIAINVIRPIVSGPND